MAYVPTVNGFHDKATVRSCSANRASPGVPAPNLYVDSDPIEKRHHHTDVEIASNKHCSSAIDMKCDPPGTTK